MDITNQANIARGSRAKEILENEIFVEAFELLEKEIVEQWTSSPARDSEGREKLFLMMGLLNRLRTQIAVVMETGKIAQVNLLHQKTLLERARDLL